MSTAGAKAVGLVMKVYAALAVVAAAYALYQGNVVRVNSEFSGLPLLLLALPWAAVFRGVRVSLLASSFNNSVATSLVWVCVNLALFAAVRAWAARGGAR